MKMNVLGFGRLVVLALVSLSMVVGQAFAAEKETALDRYIAKPDSVYGWKLVKTIPGEGYTGYILELTSQTWRSAKEVDRPVWTHVLSIVKPATIAHDTAFLTIGGGDNDDPVPERISERTVSLAVGTETVVAELGMVPNQPLFFKDSPKQDRYEDDLIAYTRVKYFVTKDEEWLVRLAMVKSAVRAMDAVQEFMKSADGGGVAVEKFVVSGGSKRGWTTWLTGAVDERVTAIIPVVIDALNSQEITRHHFNVYGFFSTALEDYVKHSLFPYAIGTPEYEEVMAIEDPYNYRSRDRLKMPKYMVNASGDQFFLPDNAHLYYDDLPEEKYIRYVPNAKHNLAGSDARESISAFYEAVLKGIERPKFSFKAEKDGAITVKCEDKPTAVNLWQATNPNARDFRLDVIGPAYTSAPLTEEGGVYVGAVKKPETGYTAYFVELVYDMGLKYPLKFTSLVSVTPHAEAFDMDTATVFDLK